MYQRDRMPEPTQVRRSSPAPPALSSAAQLASAIGNKNFTRLARRELQRWPYSIQEEAEWTAAPAAQGATTQEQAPSLPPSDVTMPEEHVTPLPEPDIMMPEEFVTASGKPRRSSGFNAGLYMDINYM